MFKEYLDEIRAKGIQSFTFSQILQDLGRSAASIKCGLHRLKKEGKLITPAKGFYVIVPPENRPYGSIPAEELTPLLMEHLGMEYYVGLLSAASFHGASHQKSGRFQVVTNKQIKHPLIFGRIELQIIYKKQITNLPVQDFVVSSGYLKVASPELTIFDLFAYPRRVGGLNHIATILSELIEVVDPKKLIALTEIIGQKAWLQRLGFILENIDFMDGSKAAKIIVLLEKYLANKNLRTVPLAAELSIVPNGFIPKWHINANTTIESDL